MASRWDELPSELIELIAELLNDDDRQSLVRTTKSWCAAIAAVPDLWPTTVIAASSEIAVDSWIGSQMLTFEEAKEDRFNDMRMEKEVLNGAAALDRLTWRVRLEGGGEHAATLWCGVLAVLPPTLRELHLNDAECDGPFFAALRRFRHLRKLTLSGAGAESIAWHGPGAALVVGKLRALCLDYRERREWDDGWRDGFYDDQVSRLAKSVAQFLAAAATRLRSLELMVLWSDSVPILCCSLPLLKDLRLSFYYCNREDAVAAVAMLQQLRSLTGLNLEIHSYSGADESDNEWPYTDGWDRWVHPNLASISALTRLRLVGAVSLPSDWTQLSSLQSLEADFNDVDFDEEMDWSQLSLTALTALTKLTVSKDGWLPDVNALATAPALKIVDLGGRESQAAVSWWEELRSLRPDLADK